VSHLLNLDTFAEFIQRVRAGEEEAATELVRVCEPHIHRAIRQPLRYYGLDRVLESSDISQSVLAAFFRRRVVFRVNLQNPEQLLRLVVRMARHRVMDELRRHQATCRDRRRLEPQRDGPIEEVVAGNDGTPSKIAAGHELIREIFSRLSAEERLLADLRTGGLDWATIGRLRGATPESLRKRLARAIERIGHQMGLGTLVIS
jgi:RNA polymerase sigma factor (sigma-70 family)